MQKQIMIMLVTLTLAITLAGSVSAANSYNIGVNVTQQAMSSTDLGLNASESNLLITTGSTAHLSDGNTTEDSVSAVVNTTSSLADKQAITYGSGNLLTINDPNGALTYTFVSLANNGALRAQTYTVTGTSTSYTINHGSAVYIGSDMTKDQWNYALEQLGDNAYSIIAIANLWAAGAPADLMASTYNSGTINAGILSNYALTKQFAQNYPKGSDETNYIFGSADSFDADNTLLQSEYDFTYELYSMTGGDPTKMAIMQYNSTSKTGVLVLMQENNLKSQFTAETGISVVNGTLSEIQYDLWLYKLLVTDPSALYTVLETKSVDESAYKYLWYDSSLGYGHGLDETYIAGLPDLTTSYDTSQTVIPVTSYDTMYEVGKNATQLAMTALGYTSEEAFAADIKAGKIGVIATPYYYNYNGVSLVGLLDGINYLGAFTISNLLTDTHPWNHAQGALKIVFFKVTNLAENAAQTTFTKVLVTVTQTASGYAYSTGAGTGPGYITLMPLAYTQGASWDFMRVFMRCGCPSRVMEDYLAAQYGLGEYTLGAGESYMIISIPLLSSSSTEIWSKMANVRSGLFGVSTALGTYLSSGASVISADTTTPYTEYILIKWNSLTNTGIAAIIQYNPTKVSELMAADGYTDRNSWILDRVFHDSSYLAAICSVLREIPLTSTTLAELTAAGGDPVDYILNYVTPTSPVTPTTPTTTAGTALNTVNGALTTALTGITTVVSSQLVPGQTSTASTVTPSNDNSATSAATPSNGNSANKNSSNMPIGAILAVMLAIIVGIVVYSQKNVVIGVMRRSEKLGK
mgnify:CR=1 FL=1|jgi:formylmethanofuran dehydrogenase subunit E-like metal-binding protein